VTPAAFKTELRAARAQSSAGAGAVLDVLTRAGHQPDTLTPLLLEVGGVALVVEPAAATPDFSQWSREQARRSRCVVVRMPQGQQVVAAEDPWDESAVQQVARAMGMSLGAAVASRATLQAWLGGEVETASRTEASPSRAPSDAQSPIVRFVDQAVQQAFATGASDVHFECGAQGVTVKHRLDGVLVRFSHMDGVQQAEETISRLKVLAKLDITERRLPQDGRFRLKTGSAEVDVRVSIMPSVHGEDAVLRLLDKAQLRGTAEAVSLDRLGFDSADGARIRALALRPSGMLLVTGPTGSGKTTTVYAALAEINTGLEKIITIEDPVEYELPGVLQIPVNEKKGLTFARGLRSILRHDPDRILVGEIRDGETADIAVQSALTGHLVFSTVHANSVSDIVGRFRHFGIDMFGFMSALNGVVVQRLMRRLCPHCRAPRAPNAEEQRWLGLAGLPDVPQLAAATGCHECHGTGFKGRFVVAEVHEIDDTVRDLVTEGAPLSALKARAREQGVVALATRGAQHVVTGETSVEEVRRVVGEPGA
jgi:general secretion pathway protein E